MQEIKSQSMEILKEDMSKVVGALVNAGYECLVKSDGVSTKITTIEYVHPMFEGLEFTVEER